MIKVINIRLLLIIVLIYSCSSSNKTRYDSNLTTNIQATYRITRDWIKKDSIYGATAYIGESAITRRIFSMDTTLIAKEIIAVVTIFKDKNRNILRFFPGYGSRVDYLFSKSNYKVKIHYWHPQGGYGKKGLNVDFSESTLTLRSDAMQLGDTLLGHIKIITRPYRENHHKFFDIYEGDFTSIIFPKDSIIKYPYQTIL